MSRWIRQAHHRLFQIRGLAMRPRTVKSCASPLNRHNIFFFSGQGIVYLSRVLIRQPLNFILGIPGLVFRDIAGFL